VQRVAVLGSPGAGKTTFSTSLAAVTGLPLIHLDEQYWRPGWVETPNDEWDRTQRALVDQPRWIMDGNYGRTVAIRLARADTVIVLSAPRRVCLYRVLKRVIANWHRDTQAPGCPEHLDVEFLKWIWNFPRESQPQLTQALDRFEGKLDIVHLANENAARTFLESLAPLAHPDS
jgi:adenylate kinase family enzyme